MNAIVKGIYYWALRWSRNEGFTLYGTLVYVRSNGFLVKELEWVDKYILRRELIDGNVSPEEES
jgi:hypothetical protein